MLDHAPKGLFALLAVSTLTLSGCGGSSVDGATNLFKVTSPHITPLARNSVVTTANQYVVASALADTSGHYASSALESYDLNGQPLWAQPQTLNEGYLSAGKDNSDNVVVAGGASSFETLTDPNGSSYSRQIFNAPFIEKYDPSGALLWRTPLGQQRFDYATMAIDIQKNTYVLTDDGEYWGFGYTLAKLDAQGQALWTQTLNVPYLYSGGNLITDSAGNLFWIITLNGDIQIRKYDSNFSPLWTYTIAGTDTSFQDRFIDAQFDPSGRLVLLTEVYNLINNKGVGTTKLVALNSSGSAAWSFQVADNASNNNISVLPTGFDIDATGNLALSNAIITAKTAVPCIPFPPYSCTTYTYKSAFLKLDSSGKQVWRVDLAQKNGAPGYQVAINPAGNIALVTGHEIRILSGTNGQTGLLQRLASSNEYGREANAVYFDTDDSLVFTGNYLIEKWQRAPKQ